MVSSVMDVTSADFATNVLQTSHQLPVVVDLWAEWCGPCKVLGPVLEKAAAEGGGRWLLAKLDVDQSPQIAQQFGVQGIPTVIAFKDGKEIDR
ncbi:MAG TPA: thioredoxin domain-containing protein, partial [Acidimicrobiia bacterium]